MHTSRARFGWASTAILLLLGAMIVETVGCSSDKPREASTFGPADSGTTDSGALNGFKPNVEDCKGKSAAAPVVKLCTDAGTPDGGTTCENDLTACQRMCDSLLPEYDYCGVDEATDGGRIARCTVAAKPCDGG